MKNGTGRKQSSVEDGNSFENWEDVFILRGTQNANKWLHLTGLRLCAPVWGTSGKDFFTKT